MLHLSIPYEAAHAGSGKLTIEVLDPDDNILGRVEKDANVTAGDGRWREEIKLEKPMGLDDLVWNRMSYHFEYNDQKETALENTESISQVLRTPVIHILGQQSYLAGGPAAVRVHRHRFER